MKTNEMLEVEKAWGVITLKGCFTFVDFEPGAYDPGDIDCQECNEYNLEKYNKCTKSK